MAWSGIILKRHPMPSQPMPKLWASKARALYLQMICAHDPRDRVLAATFGVPYEQLEMDRRLLGELQSLQRHLSIDTSRDEERRRRRLEIVAGIAAILYLLFGIESSGLPRRQDAAFRRAFLKVVRDWDNGRLGDPNSPKAVVAATIRLGRLSTDGHPREQLSYR